MVEHLKMNNTETKQVFNSILFTVGTVIQRPCSFLPSTDVNQEWLILSPYICIYTMIIYYNIQAGLTFILH